ncbi:MAG: sugar lactone lactonase YvrE [Planctomycetota bacterium]
MLQADYATHELYRIHQDGSRTLFASGFNGPVGVAIAPSGDTYAPNYSNDTISRISPSGVVSLFSNATPLNGPNGIVINDAGDIFVVNLKNKSVLRVNPNGSASILAVGPGKNEHVACIGDKLYVSAIWEHLVYEVAMHGTTTIVAGEQGSSGVIDGCVPGARHSHPNGMAASSDGKRIYTNDFAGIMGGGR